MIGKMLWAKKLGQRKNSFKSSLVGLKSAHRRSVLVWISRQLQCTKSEFSTSNIFFAILNSSSFTEIDPKKIRFFSQFFRVDFYLRIASKAFWYSCSARSYSRDKIWICSRVTAIPVRSLPLLQLVNLRPEKPKTIQYLSKVHEFRNNYHAYDDRFARLNAKYRHFCSFCNERHLS